MIKTAPKRVGLLGDLEVEAENNAGKRCCSFPDGVVQIMAAKLEHCRVMLTLKINPVNTSRVWFKQGSHLTDLFYTVSLCNLSGIGGWLL